MNDFGKKIDWEYEMFYLDIMRTSKANIFAKSGEIEAKKKIIEALRMSRSRWKSGYLPYISHTKYRKCMAIPGY